MCLVRGTWPIEVEALGASVAGTVLWKHAGRSTLTVIVKASFSLDEGTARLLSPAELIQEERSLSQTRSLFADSDIAPYKPRAEVTFVGSAWPAAPAPQVKTRLAVSGSSPLFDRTIVVFGDRAGQAAPSPFRSMPLVWDRAWADPLENPVGVQRGSGRYANLIDPADENAAAAYGPVSRSWGTRARFLGRGDPRRTEGTRPEMPAELSWGLFLSAPVDQQVSRLQGDEVFLLENLVEGRPRICTQLPNPRAVARYHGPKAPREGAAIAMRLDTVNINGFERAIHVIWRGTMAFPDEGLASASRVVAGIEMSAAQPAHTGAAQAQPAQPTKPAPSPPAPLPKDSKTMPVGRPIINVPKITDDSPLYDLDEPESSRGSTMAIDPEAAMRLLGGAKAMPWDKGPPPAPPPPPPPAPAFEGTGPKTMPVPGNPPLAAPAFPAVVVRPAGGAEIDDDDSVGSTMAITPEAAAELMARRAALTQNTAAPHAAAAPAPVQRTPAKPRPPAVPLPAPPPPVPPAPPGIPAFHSPATNVTKEGRHGTMEMEPIPDSDAGGGTMVLRPEDFAKKR